MDEHTEIQSGEIIKESYTADDILAILDAAAEKKLREQENMKFEDDFSSEEDKEEAESLSKIIDSASDDILKKEQTDILTNEIKKRFLRIKHIGKENFNMFEIAMQCHRLVQDYRKLARLNRWFEIERLFHERNREK
jgi:hypothetical protein